MDKAEKEKICEELGGLDIETYDEIAQDFINQTKEQIGQIEEQLTKDDWELLQRTSHTIKGAARNLRITEIGSLAAPMEDIAKDSKDKAAFEKAFEDLKKGFEKFSASF